MDCDFSVKAMHSSVRPRHMPSAFRRIRLSIPTIDTGLCEISDPATLPVIAARVSASATVASKVLYRSGSITAFDLRSAVFKSGCNCVISSPLIVEASGEVLFTRLCFGDEDIVVMVVDAVGGRSPKTLDIAAPDVDGNLPVSSSFFILCLRSSTSSQIVDGAVVDIVDSVSSAWT